MQRPVDHVTVCRIIEEAGRLISDPSKFSQGALARAKSGAECHVRHGYAFCPTGAMLYVAGWSEKRDILLELSTALNTTQLAASHLHKCSLEVVCDEMGHLAVMEVMRRAWTYARGSMDAVR